VRVPEAAGEGKATVKVSFDAFKGFPVASTTGTLMIRKTAAPVTPAEPATEAPKDAPAKPEAPGAPPAK
jgi:hypothetical protein